MSIGLFSCVKDEGPFLLEWIAYHFSIGFQRILIFSNDCTDGTTELLNAMMRAGHITHVVQSLGPEDIPQHTAADQAFGHPSFLDASWLMWLDTDEFLYCNNDSRTVAELAENIDADGMCINWLNFGDSGFDTWKPDLVTTRFVNRGQFSSSRHVMFKTLFKKSSCIRGFGIHRPYLKEEFVGSGKFLVNASYQPMHSEVYRSGSFRRHALGNSPIHLVSHSAATICHYAVKTRDSFELKRKRGQGTKPALARDRSSRFREKYWNIYNQNIEHDDRMVVFNSKINLLIEKYLDDAEVLRAHNDVLSRYETRLRECSLGILT